MDIHEGPFQAGDVKIEYGGTTEVSWNLSECEDYL
jgi:hypothetical protein